MNSVNICFCSAVIVLAMHQKAILSLYSPSFCFLSLE